MVNCSVPNSAANLDGKTEVLYPWLVSNGKFGYRNAEGKMVISAQYDDTKPFKKGYAVVKKNGNFGVINAQNKVIVPFKYAVAKIFNKGEFTVLVTKKERNAWWRFWQWRWWPEWNILGGSSGPTLVTKVPRSEWQVRTLPQKQVLRTLRRMDKNTEYGTIYWNKNWQSYRSIPDDLVPSVHNNLIRLKHQIYRSTGSGKLRPLQGEFIASLSDSTLLLKRGENYWVTDHKGNKLGEKHLNPVDSFAVTTSSGEKVFVLQKNEDMPAYPIIPGGMYQNDKGKVFLSSDFSKSFPQTVDDYEKDSLSFTGKDILRTTEMIAPLPSGYFMIVSYVGGFDRYAFLLDQNGHWNTSMPLHKGPDHVTDNGDIVFFRSKTKGVLTSDLKFYAMPMTFIHRSSNPFWYMGKDTVSGNYGVYDIQKQAWQIPSKYSYLQDEITPNIAIYSIVIKANNGQEREYSGLLNLETGKEITSPKYDRIERDGRVTEQINDQEIHFYINLKTGEEYRTLKK